jgi:hypothetical protein
MMSVLRFAGPAYVASVVLVVLSLVTFPFLSGELRQDVFLLALVSTAFSFGHGVGLQRGQTNWEPVVKQAIANAEESMKLARQTLELHAELAKATEDLLPRGGRDATTP